MKRLIYILLLISLSCFAYSEVIERIVAKVGSDIILQSEFENHRKQLEQMGQLPEGTTDLDILNDMVESKLIIQSAKDKDYEVDEFRIRQMVNSQIDVQINRFGSESAFRRELSNAGMTLSQLRSFYEEMIREQRLREMIIQNEIKSKVNVSDIDIEEYYYENFDDLPLRPEKIEIGLIRVDIKPTDSTLKAVRKEINRIYDRVREGKDFAELAREYSDCPSSSIGGDLGFFGRGTMLREFEDVAFSLKPGEISGIIESSFGYHIIKMEEKDEEDIRVRHILKMIKPTEEDISSTVEIVKGIHEELMQGADFYEIAKKYSDDPSAEEGGIIGEYSADEYPESFKEYLDRIDVGEITEIIREEMSLFILSKNKFVAERPFLLDEVKEELKEYLLMHKQVDQFGKWIKELKDNSYVEILLY